DTFLVHVFNVRIKLYRTPGLKLKPFTSSPLDSPSASNVAILKTPPLIKFWLIAVASLVIARTPPAGILGKITGFPAGALEPKVIEPSINFNDTFKATGLNVGLVMFVMAPVIRLSIFNVVVISLNFGARRAFS